MKGLILKDIELMKGNRRLYAGAYLIAVMMLFMTGMNTIFFVSYVSIMSGVIGLNTLSFDQADDTAGFEENLCGRKIHFWHVFLSGQLGDCHDHQSGDLRCDR